MRLYIIRHAETEFNMQRRIQGSICAPFSEEGENQARKLAASFSGKKISEIYSSKLGRAYRTAQAIAFKHDIKVKTSEALNERAYGIYEGKELDKVKAEHSEFFARQPDLDLEAKPEGGESINEVAARVLPFLKQILSNARPESCILIVAHGIVNKVILAHLVDGDISHAHKYRQFNTCVNELVMENGKTEVVRLNDVSHLA